MIKTILIIGGGQAQLPLVETALKMGHHVAVVDERGMKCSRLAHKVYPYNRYDWNQIQQIAPRDNIHAVVSGGSDKAVNIMARYAQKYGLPSYVSVRESELPMQKGITRELLHAAGVPVPRSVEIGDVFDTSCIYGLTAPFVVKPVDGIGQLGVSFVSGVQFLKNAIDLARQASISGRILLQEFIEGPEIGVNGFVFNGNFDLCTIGTRRASRENDETFGVALEKEHYRLRYSPVEDAVRRVVGDACKTLGFREGPIYAQLILDDSGTPYVIEVMPRLSGGEDPRLVKLATGFDITAATIATALGEPFIKSNFVAPVSYDSVLVRFLTANQGILESVIGLETACAMPGIAHTDIFYDAGHKIGKVKSSRERLGCIIGVGKTPEETRKCVEDAVAAIRINTQQTKMG